MAARKEKCNTDTVAGRERLEVQAAPTVGDALGPAVGEALSPEVACL